VGETICGETISGCFLSVCWRVASSGEVVNYVQVAWAIKSIGQLSRFRTHDINLRKSGDHCRIFEVNNLRMQIYSGRQGGITPSRNSEIVWLGCDLLTQ